MENKRILITGATKFLGYAIKNYLIDNNYNIYNVYVNNKSNNSNIIFYLPNSNDCNCLDLNILNNFISFNKITHIFHAAAKCFGIGGNAKFPAELISENTKMAINIYDAAKTNNIKYVYTLGSVCSYPSETNIPFKESDIWYGRPHSSNEPYGEYKRHMIILGEAYRRQYGILGGQLIPINMLGPADHFDLENSHVVPALIRKIYEAKNKSEKSIVVWGTGKAKRSFLDSRDCARAIITACLSNLDFEAPINLGPKEDIFIKDLANLISKIVDYKGEILFDKNKSDGQMRRLLDTSRAKTILNWQTEITFINSLTDTINWYIDNREMIINQ